MEADQLVAAPGDQEPGRIEPRLAPRGPRGRRAVHRPCSGCVANAAALTCSHASSSRPAANARTSTPSGTARRPSGRSRAAGAAGAARARASKPALAERRGQPRAARPCDQTRDVVAAEGRRAAASTASGSAAISSDAPSRWAYPTTVAAVARRRHCAHRADAELRAAPGPTAGRGRRRALDLLDQRAHRGRGRSRRGRRASVTATCGTSANASVARRGRQPTGDAPPIRGRRGVRRPAGRTCSRRCARCRSCCSCSGPSLARSRRTCTSTVRVPPK